MSSCPEQEKIIISVRVGTEDVLIPNCKSHTLSRIIESIFTYLEIDEESADYDVSVYNGEEWLSRSKLLTYMDKTLVELEEKYGWDLEKMRIHISRDVVKAETGQPSSGGRSISSPEMGVKYQGRIPVPGLHTFIISALLFIFASAAAVYTSYNAYEFPAYYMPVIIGFIVGTLTSILGKSIITGFSMGFIAGIFVSIILIMAS